MKRVKSLNVAQNIIRTYNYMDPRNPQERIEMFDTLYKLHKSTETHPVWGFAHTFPDKSGITGHMTAEEWGEYLEGMVDTGT